MSHQLILLNAHTQYHFPSETSHSLALITQMAFYSHIRLTDSVESETPCSLKKNDSLIRCYTKVWITFIKSYCYSIFQYHNHELPFFHHGIPFLLEACPNTKESAQECPLWLGGRPSVDRGGDDLRD